LSPPQLRATPTGLFWAVTYRGFGLAVLLVMIEPVVGITAPMIVLSIVAVVVVVLRAARGSSAKHAAAQTVRDEAARSTQNMNELRTSANVTQ
jgi:hypothetical protein